MPFPLGTSKKKNGKGDAKNTSLGAHAATLHTASQNSIMPLQTDGNKDGRDDSKTAELAKTKHGQERNVNFKAKGNEEKTEGKKQSIGQDQAGNATDPKDLKTFNSSIDSAKDTPKQTDDQKSNIPQKDDQNIDGNDDGKTPTSALTKHSRATSGINHQGNSENNIEGGGGDTIDETQSSTANHGNAKTQKASLPTDEIPSKMSPQKYQKKDGRNNKKTATLEETNHGEERNVPVKETCYKENYVRMGQPLRQAGNASDSNDTSPLNSPIVSTPDTSTRTAGQNSCYSSNEMGKGKPTVGTKGGNATVASSTKGIGVGNRNVVKGQNNAQCVTVETSKPTDDCGHDHTPHANTSNSTGNVTDGVATDAERNAEETKDNVVCTHIQTVWGLRLDLVLLSIAVVIAAIVLKLPFVTKPPALEEHSNHIPQELRDFKKLLNEVKTEMADLKSEVNTNRDKINIHSSKLVKIEDIVSPNDPDEILYPNIKNKFIEILEQIAKSKDDIGGLERKHIEVKGAVDNLELDHTAFTNKQKQIYSDLSKNIKQTRDSVTENSNANSALSGRVHNDEVDAKIIESDFDDTNSKISGIQKDLGEVDEKLIEVIQNAATAQDMVDQSDAKLKIVEQHLFNKDALTAAILILLFLIIGLMVYVLKLKSSLESSVKGESTSRILRYDELVRKIDGLEKQLKEKKERDEKQEFELLRRETKEATLGETQFSLKKWENP